MKGADEFASLFASQGEQVGRLYIRPGEHARGATLHVWVLPEGDRSPSGDAVEVYGIIGGQPGWTEEYGWLHRGPWEADFDAVVAQRRAVATARRVGDAEVAAEHMQEERRRQAAVLATYKPEVLHGEV